MQNQSLRDELAALKLSSEAGAISVAASAPNDDDPPPKYEEDYPGSYHKARHCSSSSESGPKDGGELIIPTEILRHSRNDSRTMQMDYW